jgi:hypothetical protein
MQEDLFEILEAIASMEAFIRARVVHVCHSSIFDIFQIIVMSYMLNCQLISSETEISSLYSIDTRLHYIARNVFYIRSKECGLKEK